MNKQRVSNKNKILYIFLLIIIFIIILFALWQKLNFDFQSISLSPLEKDNIEVVTENDVVAENSETQQPVDQHNSNEKGDENLDQISEQSGCSNEEKRANLANSSSPHMRKLAEYEQVCDSSVFSKHKFFVEMISFQKSAEVKAEELAFTLKEFSKFNIMPVVIVEPISDLGEIDLDKFLSGEYDSWLNRYFASLKSQGITDRQMGLWLPFPEANTPAFANYQGIDKSDFALLINKYLSIYKSHFPLGQGGISLDSTTYTSDDLDWSDGQYISLLPYVAGIKDGLVDSFCLQGFPWAGRAGSGYEPISDPHVFLNADLAAEAASALGVSEIWFNTGTFSSKYRGTDRKVSINKSERSEILNGIVKEANYLKNMNYSVWINLFAEDKTSSAEETNWSYWTDLSDIASDHRDVFVDFASTALSFGIELSLYDSE